MILKGTGSDGLPAEHDNGAPNEWSEVIAGLRALTPAEPDAAASERVWQRIQLAVSPQDAMVERLRAADPGEPEPAALARAWQHAAQQLHGTPSTGRHTAPVRWYASAGLRRVTAALVVLLIVGAGALGAAAASLPGTAAYPIKQAYEAALWRLAFTPEAQTNIALFLAGERRSESERLVVSGAEPALVVKTVNDGLGYLTVSRSTLPSEQVEKQVRAWQEASQRWPGAYRVPAAKALDAWIAANPVAPVTPPLALPTLGPAFPQATLPVVRPGAAATVVRSPAATVAPIATANRLPTLVPAPPVLKATAPVLLTALPTTVPLPTLPALSLTPARLLTQTLDLPTTVFNPALPPILQTATPVP